ncbi:DUF7341 domain-containing protein [Leucobacter japonicus]|uniref:DUF7341 domain-containing protein n=1 Tax=Leucobacter japonicus TaxID=1461259 RepID=UPI0006A75D12|nr:hypothetical protein [Leucobacter japonicus]
MESTERAVTRLTEPHTELTEAGPVEWPALIDWLNDAITEQVKRGQAGSGGTGSPIDMAALGLLQRIEKGVRQLREALYLPIMRDAKAALRDAWDAAKTQRATGDLDDDQQWERITDAIPGWVLEIEQEWDDRTRRMELTVPCPRCGERWLLEPVGDGVSEPKRRAAVWIEYADMRAPVAECRNPDCAAIWAGWDAIAQLGYTVGADQNAEVLAACGIDLRGLLAS